MRSLKRGQTGRIVMAGATMVGTVIGVGVFGIPYAISQSGLLLALVYFLILGGVQLLQVLFFAETVMVCPERLRLAGLAGHYLGPKARYVATVSTVLGFWGGLVAYILVGGSFLHLLLSPLLGGEVIYYQLIWGLLGALVVRFGSDLVEKIDFWTTVALLAAMALVVAVISGHLNPVNVALLPSGDLFLPYGVILFSLSGISAIPEMEEFLGGRRKGFRVAIVGGFVVSLLLTVLFGLTVYAVTGNSTTTDALSGLQVVLGSGIIRFGAAFGFLAVATSYFIIGLDLKMAFEYDYRFRQPVAWALAVLVPLVLVILGVNNFITTIGFTGAVFGGVTAVIVSLLFLKVTKLNLLGLQKLRIAPFWAYLSIVLLLIGAAYEAVRTFV